MGEDFEPEFWHWFESWGIDASGLEVLTERTPRSKLAYGCNGDRVESARLGEVHFRQFALELADVAPENLRSKGLYVFREAEREFWDELLAATEVSGAKVLWEMDERSCHPRCWSDVRGSIAWHRRSLHQPP